jgi:hypothetical protein
VAPERSPFAREVARRIESEGRALVELHRRFEAAKDTPTALAIQQEIEALKRETEVFLLRLQAERARREGRPELAARIEQAIETITNPKLETTATPRPRPLPGARSEGRGER